MTRSRLPICLAASLLTGAAWAHPGHIDEVAGHSHWLAYGAAAVAVTLAAGGLVWAVRRRRSQDR